MTDQSPSPDRGRLWRRSGLAAILLVGTTLGGLAVGRADVPNNNAQNSNAQNTVNGGGGGTPVNPPGTRVAPQPLPDFTSLVGQVKPAVVSITTMLKNNQAAMEDSDQGGPGGPGGQMPQLPFPFNQMIPQQPQQQMRAVEARGSGFIINANGTIVTNNHVVRDARSVKVTLDDGTTLPAKVIGTDPRTDIAVLKVDAGHPLPYIQLGDSRDVKPGEWVIAMGNPFGLGGTVTAGIVSAVSRDIGDGPYDEFIQVDAPINQGNSGGPLFTQNGKVIGMNTAILSPSGGSIGIGFAIPSNMIKTIAAQLVEYGHVTRGYVGVEAQQITGATAKAMNLPDNSGALLAGIQPDSPAAKAGLQPGDVIEAVNGQKVANPRDLAVDIAAIHPGDEAHLKVERNGQTQDVNLKVAQMPSEQQMASNGGGGGGQADHPQIGLALAPLSPDMRDQLDIPSGTHGVVVRRVVPGSPADQAGLQAGDVIVGVGTHPVNSPSDAVREMRSALNGKDHALALRVIRNGEPVFVGVQVGQNDNAG